TLPCNPTDAQILAAFGTASATDNCCAQADRGANRAEITVPQCVTLQSSVGDEQGTGCTRTRTKTWIGTDGCGNTQTASQTLTYQRDTQKPVISITPAGTLPCNPTSAQIAAAFGTATATDNCTTELSPSGTIGTEFGSGC